MLSTKLVYKIFNTRLEVIQAEFATLNSTLVSISCVALMVWYILFKIALSAAFKALSNDTSVPYHKH